MCPLTGNLERQPMSISPPVQLQIPEQQHRGLKMGLQMDGKFLVDHCKVYGNF